MIDTYINKRKDAPTKNKESLMENIRLVLKSETVFEDEAMGLSINLITPDEIKALDEDQKNKMMLGVDIENDEEEVDRKRKKEMKNSEAEQLKDIKDDVDRKIANVLDLGWYHLGDDGLQAIVPHLISDHIQSVDVLDLSYNDLTSAGLNTFIQNMASRGSQI
jgi:hypothetical protein